MVPEKVVLLTIISASETEVINQYIEFLFVHLRHCHTRRAYRTLLVSCLV
ncbi:MAG: hypothetical protein AAGB19_19585 [Cyanobacteria bacterium P01_F01_bin.3]